MLQSENSAEIENKGAISAELTYIVRQKEKPYFESSHSTGGEPKVFFKTEKRKGSQKFRTEERKGSQNSFFNERKSFNNNFG